jgi:hypothetical protein
MSSKIASVADIGFQGMRVDIECQISTGLPHYGTLLSSIPKDLYPRFWTMKGYRVRRVWGWDG